MEDKELKEKLGFISFDVGIGSGKTQKHFLSPIVVKQILTIVKEAGYHKVPSGEPSIISNDEIGLTISEIRLEAGESVALWNWSCWRAVAEAQRDADAKFYKENHDEEVTIKAP